MEPRRRQLQQQGWKMDGLGATGTMRQELGWGKGRWQRQRPEASSSQEQSTATGPRERRTGLLQLGNVDQGTVLGAAQHFLQPLQAHFHLALCCHLLQHLLHLFSIEGRAAQEPVQGAHQRPAQTDALLCSAVAAARREKHNRGPSYAPMETKARQWGSLRNQATSLTPSPACSAPGSCAAAPSPRASPHARGNQVYPVQTPLWPLNYRKLSKPLIKLSF